MALRVKLACAKVPKAFRHFFIQNIISPNQINYQSSGNVIFATSQRFIARAVSLSYLKDKRIDAKLHFFKYS